MKKCQSGMSDCVVGCSRTSELHHSPDDISLICRFRCHNSLKLLHLTSHITLAVHLHALSPFFLKAQPVARKSDECEKHNSSSCPGDTDRDSLLVCPSPGHSYFPCLSSPTCKVVLPLFYKMHWNLEMKTSKYHSSKPHLSSYSLPFALSASSYQASSHPLALKTKLGQGFVLQWTYCN